jgi:DNA-directed RNA polymerase subunit RPC12/RpoP
MRIVLQLPKVKREKAERPSHCPYCQGETFQGWGKVSRQIKDTKVRTVKVARYKCTNCQRTFRFHPEGVTPAQQSERLKKLCPQRTGIM